MLFLFAGSVQGIKDIIASNKGNLQKDQILVAVAKDGEIEDYQASLCDLLKLWVCVYSVHHQHVCALWSKCQSLWRGLTTH